MKTTSMSHQARLQTFLVLLLIPLMAQADPCEQELGRVDPGGAAVIRADENQARQKVAEEFEHANSDDGDAQYKARDAGKILDIASNHHKFETPFFAAGIMKAMMKGDIKAATVLGECVQRRTGQSVADAIAAAKNHAIGEKTIQADPNKKGYEPEVITVMDGEPKGQSEVVALDSVKWSEK